MTQLRLIKAKSGSPKILATSVCSKREASGSLGNDCYSYYFVQKAFLPLLRRLGEVIEVEKPEADLARAADAALQGDRDVVHVCFLPLQYAHRAEGATNIAFPFWEFPDIPAHSVNGNDRFNWVTQSTGLSSILTACEFTKQAIQEAGITVPVHVTPVPVDDAWFGVPDWRTDQQVRMGVHHLCFGNHSDSKGAAHAPDSGIDSVDPEPVEPVSSPPQAAAAPRTITALARSFYRRGIKPWIPNRLHGQLCRIYDDLRKTARQATITPLSAATPDPNSAAEMVLSGIVYTTIFNPFDERKNWRDIVSAFLFALGKRSDATLVLKLAVSRPLVQEAQAQFNEWHRRIGDEHAARILIVTDFLSDEQLTDLARGTTYYVNASRAEGACLPLQDFMAAGRPGIAPAHTAMAEYFDDQVGFTVHSSEEPTHYPWDSEKGLSTFWHRIDWQSLHDAFQASYVMAHNQPERYQQVAAAARSRILGHAGQEAVYPKLAAALNSVGRISAAA